MTTFIIRRLLQAIPTMLGITLISYLIMWAAPGDPAMLMSRNPKLSPAQREALAARMGVNQSPVIQYLRWLIGNDWQTFDIVDRDGNVIGSERGTQKGVLRGDFGTSFKAGRPAMDILLEKIPATLELAFIAFVFGLTSGLIIGLLAAVMQGGLFDQFSRVLAVIFSSVPGFWLGLILLLIFGSWLGWLPMGNRFPMRLSGGYTLWERIRHLILPVFVLATGGIAIYSRFMRAAVLDVLNQDYVRTAKSKGLDDRTIWVRHTARNALIPIVTIAGPAIPNLIGGALIIEKIFSWPGMGRLTYESVLNQDYPVVMASVILTGAATILGYLLTDILYAVVDPRVRLH